jgi:membrane protease YdiL (CAAX protease family)
MARVWLTWGKLRYWLFFGLGLVVYYALQVVLNALFNLGGSSLAQPVTHSPILLILAGVQTVFLTPLLAILIFFGEEYGWRGYLQNELLKLGRLRGVLLVGVIWGAWHWPIILMGVNYPGHPLLGVLLMTLYSTGNAIILGYAVLKAGSVLLAAYLHGILDQVINFIVALGFRPHDPAFSFGIGIYGIATLAIVAFFILRDPIWRDRGSNMP